MNTTHYSTSNAPVGWNLQSMQSVTPYLVKLAGLVCMLVVGRAHQWRILPDLWGVKKLGRHTLASSLRRPLGLQNAPGRGP